MSAEVTWRDGFNEFDVLHVVWPNAGSAEVDLGINNLMAQLMAIRRTCEAGFTRQDAAYQLLNPYDTAIQLELGTIKVDLKTTVNPEETVGNKMDNMQASIHQMQTTLNADDITQRFIRAENRILSVEDDMKMKYDTLNKIAEKQNIAIASITKDGDPTNFGTRLAYNKSLLESRAIQNLEVFSGQRTDYKEWSHVVKTVAYDVSKDKAIEFRMEIG
jgi:hypothetical protein